MPTGSSSRAETSPGRWARRRRRAVLASTRPSSIAHLMTPLPQDAVIPLVYRALGSHPPVGPRIEREVAGGEKNMEERAGRQSRHGPPPRPGCFHEGPERQVAREQRDGTEDVVVAGERGRDVKKKKAQMRSTVATASPRTLRQGSPARLRSVGRKRTSSIRRGCTRPRIPRTRTKGIRPGVSRRSSCGVCPACWRKRGSSKLAKERKRAVMGTIAVTFWVPTLQVPWSASKKLAKPYRASVGASSARGTAAPTISQTICAGVRRRSRARTTMATRTKGSKSGHER